MQVYPEKLAATLKQGIKAVYMVSGDEPLLVQEAGDLIRAHLRQAGYTERQRFDVETNFNWDDVLFSANSMSLFAELKIIELRFGKKPDKFATQALKDFAEHLPDDTVLLMVMPKLEKAVTNAGWFKQLDKLGVHVAVWPVERDKLSSWLSGRLKQAGLSAPPDALAALAGRVEGNLLAAAQEIEQLRLIYGRGELTLDQVVSGVGDSARFDVFKLIDTAVNQEPARALRIIGGLQLEGITTHELVPLLAKEVRNLAAMAATKEQGQSIDSVLQQYHVWPKRKPLVSHCLQNQSRARLETILQELGRLDKVGKGIGQGDPWSQLMSLILRLAGSPLGSKPHTAKRLPG